MLYPQLENPFLNDFISEQQEEVQANNEEEQIENNGTEIAENEESAEAALSPERQRLEMEIRTSTLSELAVWCRTLGLSESGTREDLSLRLREHFSLPEPSQENDDRKVITIESAQITEYFSIDVIDEDYARLTGDVSLSLQDGETIHKIRADEILFNRTRNILTARGQVIYERIDEEKTETFRGENITVNIDNWSSVLLDGSSTRALDSDGTAYLFSGTVISRSEDEVTILSRATISNAANEEALWSINASRLWLLPVSDFAIFNAVLKVGEIPLLYIPFFYFPGDQLVFHPVIGYRSREGAFVQTTTYLLGQPRSDPSETSSLSRIMGNSNDMERERQGLFLRNTGRRILNPDELRLKALVDYYVNLGTYVGLDLSVPRTGILNPLELSLGIGFTRTINQIDGNFTPYIPNEDGFFDGSFDQNHSNFFSEPVPFRYRIRTQSSIGGRFGNLSWNLPYYSDPFVDIDFLNRTETMDWMNIIQQGAAFDDEESSHQEIGDYRWNIHGNLNPSIPIIAPYVSRINITNISTTLSFKRIRDADIFANNAESPQRYFYAPDRYTIYSISGSIAGTPLTIGDANARNRRRTASGAAQEITDPFSGIGVPISPWARNEESAEGVSAGGVPTGGGTEIISPPVLAQTFALPRTGNNRFSVDYQISPSGSSELQFMNAGWTAYDMVDWSEVQTILTNTGGSANINFRLDHTSGLYNNTVTFSGSGTWRDYSYINEDAFLNSNGEVDENRINQLKRQQYSQTNYSTFYSYLGTVRPLHDNQIFGQSNLQYNFRGTLVRSQRYSADTSPYGPELTPQWGRWVKEERRDGVDILGLNIHRFSTNFAANIMDRNQTISVSTDLPPLDALIITNATFRFWISETNINFRIEKPDTPTESGEWKFRPIYITETLRFNRVGSFVGNMVIKPEEDNDITNLSASLLLWNFRTTYVMEKMVGHEFDNGWVRREDDPTLQPKELTFAYNRTTTNRELTNRINLAFNANTSLNFDLDRHTNSNFQLTTGFTLNINGILQLNLSATARNTVIWRYFKEIPAMEKFTFMYPEGPQNNIFLDLFDSFNFSDDIKRQRSGFKIQRMEFKAIHFLGDWHAELAVSMYPHQNTASANRNFVIASDISFLIQWKPIVEIKTDVGYDGRHERWIVR